MERNQILIAIGLIIVAAGAYYYFQNREASVNAAAQTSGCSSCSSGNCSASH